MVASGSQSLRIGEKNGILGIKSGIWSNLVSAPITRITIQISFLQAQYSNIPLYGYPQSSSGESTPAIGYPSADRPKLATKAVYGPSLNTSLTPLAVNGCSIPAGPIDMRRPQVGLSCSDSCPVCGPTPNGLPTRRTGVLWITVFLNS